MKAKRLLTICILAAVGCSPAADRGKEAPETSAEHAPRSPLTAEPESLPPRITNRFGMTFRLVEVDTSRSDHKDSFPDSSFYLQETELTGEQYSAFRKAAFGEGTGETIDWPYNGGFPSEWREVIQYAQALSKFDTQYDYRLPSREEWLFACMSGYEHRCDEDKPNAYGFVDMLDGDAEVIGEFHEMKGHEYGILMGRWKNNWGEHDGDPEPECRCEHWTVCNPDADDSLNEVIVGRFVLLPKDVAGGTGE